MDALEKAKAKAEQLKGRAKEAAGSVNSDTVRQQKGRLVEAAGNLRQAGEKLRRAVRRPH